MKKELSVFGATVGVFLGCVLPLASAQADDTGLAQALHDVRREGGKLCQVDHFHFGSSAGLQSKKHAMADAISFWQGFTAAEYGTDWANYRIAGSKSAKCTVSSGGWGCEVEARPCKRLGRRR